MKEPKAKKLKLKTKNDQDVEPVVKKQKKQQKKEADKKEEKEEEQTEIEEPVEVERPTKTSARDELRARLTKQLKASEFRFLNEKLYRASDSTQVLDSESA